ncbi:NACHT domain-and WD repeat-containing protein 1 [Trichonephila clavipes]|nr:NACHT domain-and WD repeat-containing protein 1 [Trichonephila clavipes]
MRKVATFLACTTFGLRENELIELLASSVEATDDNQKLAKPKTWFMTVKEMSRYYQYVVVLDRLVHPIS